jgi:hypothetical protein
MSDTSFIGLHPFQLIAFLTAVMTLLLLGDAFAGHYRSGFASRAQFAPFVSGGLLITAALIASVAPGVSWANPFLRVARWLAVMTGVVGFGFHHYYGIARKPGGYRWLLHYLMYSAPQLAPLALALLGVFGLATARGLAGDTEFAGLNMRAALLALAAVGLGGSALQSAILHYRGAFNNAAMYAPLIAPVLAVVALTLTVLAPGRLPLTSVAVLLWLTFLTGSVGLGMHLRGFGRQMGGLYVTVFSWLEGPPAFAPALFAGLAAVGLVAAYLL